MEYQEKRTLVSLISTLAVSAGYFAYVLQRVEEGNPSEELRFWAAVILIFVPVQVISKVAVFVVFSIFNYIATQEEEPDIVDERDRLIELKSTRNFYHVFMAGFMLSMGLLVLEVSVTTMFTFLLAAIVVAGAIMDLSQLYYYRRGV